MSMSNGRRVTVRCAYCGSVVEKSVGAVNRAAKTGAPLYCNRECAGLGRRVYKTDAERRAKKAEYDREYRAKNFDQIKARKAAHYQRTRDPEKKAAIRKERMHLHLEYCRRPEYRAWKSEYDRQYRARRLYGDFADAYLTLLEVENELDDQATNYERRLQNGTYNKAQFRRRALCQTN